MYSNQRTFLAKLANYEGRRSGVSGMLQVFFAEQLRLLLVYRYILLAYRYILLLRSVPCPFGFDLVDRYILPEAATITSIEPVLG